MADCTVTTILFETETIAPGHPAWIFPAICALQEKEALTQNGPTKLNMWGHLVYT